MTRQEIVAVFKLKRNKKEIARLREDSDLGERKISLGQMIAEAFPDEESLFRDDEDDMHDWFGFENEPAEPASPAVQAPESNESAESAPAVTEEEQSSAQAAMKPDEDSDFEKPKETNIIHPWNIVDYHLYLTAIENGAGEHIKRHCMYLFDGSWCRPFLYRDFFEKEGEEGDAFSPDKVGPAPQLLFGILPIAERGPYFNGMKYLLGFDWNAKKIFARRFTWIPDEIEDIWTVWEEGQIVYQFSIPELRRMMRASISHGDGSIDVTCLGSSDHCLIKGVGDGPGLEMVIVIQCCQWVTDLAEVFWKHEDEIRCVKEELIGIAHEWQLVLQRASHRAWFALDDGMPKDADARKLLMDEVISDLCNFNQSKMLENVYDNSWHAPSQDTCERIRQRCWDQYREEAMERVGKKYERVFSPTYSAISTMSPGKTLGNIVGRAGCLSGPAASFLDIPSTPPQAEPFWMPPSPSSDTSEEIVSPATGKYDSQYDGIRLCAMLTVLTGFIEQNPALDIPHYRRRLGALMDYMGLSLVNREPPREERRPLAQQKRDSGFGYSEEEWGEELKAMGDTEESNENFVARVPALLPSPILD
ncbi:hypothetical protein DTO271G3_2458 [Paecilomyces variotii]|nr:hypothetical protein DTO271G3_2458 [Paecilomyces variotii]